MASVSPSPTPNPNAMKFTLDVKLPGTINFANAAAAEGNAFAAAVFRVPGVASVFGVNDFITVSRTPGADWEIIIEGVRTAAAEHL